MNMTDYANKSPLGAAELTRLEEQGGVITKPTDSQRQHLVVRYGTPPVLICTMPDSSVWFAFEDDTDNEPQVFEAIAA